MSDPGGGAAPISEARREMLPPRLLPTLYIGWAHLCLVAAFALVAIRPGAASGFFYDPHLLAVVHLITLGWISSYILGAIHVVGPLALRMPMTVLWPDYVACALVVAGTAGMAGHMWTGRHAGTAGSALLVIAGIAWVTGRIWRRLWIAPIPGPVKVHVALAFLNILAAGLWGALLGFDKEGNFLGGSTLPNLYAHAHLAALGWAAMMIVGVGYRMLPMMLPSAMPSWKGLAASAALLEAGALGLFYGFLHRGRGLGVSALLAVAAFVVFALHVRWMVRHRRPAPAARPKPDFHVWHVAQAMAYLGLAALLGLDLVFTDLADRTLGPSAAYGVMGLVGFLAQVVIGVEATLLPLFAGTHALAEGGYSPDAVSVHRMAHRGAQAAAFALWTGGVPALALGAGLGIRALAGLGGWLLLAAAVLGAFNAARVLRHAFRFMDPGPSRR